jgi:hypothetical protein
MQFLQVFHRTGRYRSTESQNAVEYKEHHLFLKNLQRSLQHTDKIYQTLNKAIGIVTIAQIHQV